MMTSAMFSLVLLGLTTTRALGLVMVKTPPPQPRLALITFDLDDTLFPVAQVVTDANDAMMQAMWDAGYADATNARIVHHTKSIRNKKKKQMTYTTLRKKAILMEMVDLSPPGKAVDYDVVTSVYDAWLTARHKSAEDHLFDGCLDMLSDLSKKHPEACIAAITNGRGDPMDMADTLAPFFSFCVSGEDTDVFPERKPHRGIYKVALQRYHEHYANERKISATEHVWCHVGDCLANDVGGSSKMGAYTIWTELDDLERLNGATAASQLNGGPQPSWSTAPAKLTNSRKKLANAARGSVTEKVTTLSELPGAVDSILHKAYKKSLLPNYNSRYSSK
jgi:putative hydrolase of the HAD superfamily